MEFVLYTRPRFPICFDGIRGYFKLFHLYQFREGRFKINSIPWFVRIVQCNFNCMGRIIRRDPHGILPALTLENLSYTGTGEQIPRSMVRCVNSPVLIEIVFTCFPLVSHDTGFSFLQGYTRQNGRKKSSSALMPGDCVCDDSINRD